MEMGEFHARLPKFKLREMGAISDTFNRMAQAIEESFTVKRQAEKTALELKENRELTQIIQRHIEEERRNLALELHDELGQSVTAVKSIATSLVNRTKEKHPDLQSSAQMIVDVSGQMYDSMHGMCGLIPKRPTAGISEVWPNVTVLLRWFARILPGAGGVQEFFDFGECVGVECT